MKDATEVQLTCEWRCLCPCGIYRLVRADTRSQAESRLRQAGWRKVGETLLQWACAKCALKEMANGSLN